MNNCPLCNFELIPTQTVILSNEHCMFLQLKDASQKGIQLEGAGIIVPKIHRETTFELTLESYLSHAHFHVLPRYDDEPLVGKGIRFMFKGDENNRKPIKSVSE